jgi:purine nucleoside phosphorylase
MLAVVGGSSLLGSRMFAGLERRDVATSLGVVVVHAGAGLVFVQRHKTLPEQRYELPHEVRHAAIAEALAALGATGVLGVASVGSLSPAVPPGSVCVPDDYFNVWGVSSGLSDERAHVAPCYEPQLRALVAAAVEGAGRPALPGVYVQTRGPRFETKAEVRFLATLGQVSTRASISLLSKNRWWE